MLPKKDLMKEAELARAITFPPNAEELGLSSAYVYGSVLHSLWDSGFYDYVRQHPRFVPAKVVAELGFDAMTFEWLMYYLIGRAVVRPVQGNAATKYSSDMELELTET